MKTKGDLVNLEYNISNRKRTAADWITKFSQKTLKQVNIQRFIKFST